LAAPKSIPGRSVLFGRALGISDNTVKNHVDSIIEKLEVSDRTEAATTAIQRGLISLDD
jgi:two-component system NarL family response regulator